MRCQFLAETQVRSCSVVPGSKVPARTGAGDGGERCSSGAYTDCPVYRASPAIAGSSCPYLVTSSVRYCSAAPGMRPIPNGPHPSRCNSGCHVYCCLYRERLGTDFEGPVVDGIRVPESLRYAANHLWLHVAEDGWCHAGIDGLVAKLVGRVESVTAITSRSRPAAVLRTRGLEWQVEFPNPIPDAAGNPHVRAHPECVSTDPYGGGWLFSGRAALPGNEVVKGLIAGEQAAEWMRRELERVSAALQVRRLQDVLEPEEAFRVFQDLCQ